MKSFINSLPSHRKKEKERKSRGRQRPRESRGRQSNNSHHHYAHANRSSLSSHSHYDHANRSSLSSLNERPYHASHGIGGRVSNDSGGMEESSDRGGPSSTSFLHHSHSQQSQSSPGSIVEETEIQHPPRGNNTMMMGRSSMDRRLLDNYAATGDGDSNDRRGSGLAAAVAAQMGDENDNHESSQEETTLLSQSQDETIVEATQFNYPPMMKKAPPQQPPSDNMSNVRNENNNGGKKTASLESSLQEGYQNNHAPSSSLPSPVHSSSALAATSAAVFDQAYDEETVGMNSPQREVDSRKLSSGKVDLEGKKNNAFNEKYTQHTDNAIEERVDRSEDDLMMGRKSSSALAATTTTTVFDQAYDEETEGMNSPEQRGLDNRKQPLLGEKKNNDYAFNEKQNTHTDKSIGGERVDRSKDNPESNNSAKGDKQSLNTGSIMNRVNNHGEINHSSRRSSQLLESEPHNNTYRRKNSSSAERNLSMETEPRGNVSSKGGTNTLSRRDLALDTEPRDSSNKETSSSAKRTLPTGAESFGKRDIEAETRGNTSSESNLPLPTGTEPRGSMNRESNITTTKDLPMEMDSAGITRMKDNSLPKSSISSRGEAEGNARKEDRQKIKKQPLDANPVTNSNQKANEMRTPATGCAQDSSVAAAQTGSGSSRKDMQPDGDRRLMDADETTELVLTTSDIRGCTNAMKVAKQIMEADLSQDPFDGIDLDQWQSIFEDFQMYVAALGNSASAESQELQQIDINDRSFAIFDRGMDVNHCNAVFIFNMIDTMSDSIESYARSHPTNHEARNGFHQLDNMAACLDAIYGVNEDTDPIPATTSIKTSGNTTTLTFAPTSVSQDNGVPVSTATEPSPSTLQPHLLAMSQVFQRFAEERSKPVQSQLDSARRTLSATREGAVELQRQALKLQDDLQEAQSLAEEARSKQERAKVEFDRQKYEFDRREQSFERVKEHYKAELDRKQLELTTLKEQYERQLKEAKADLTKEKARHSERRSTESRKRKESGDKHDKHPAHHTKHQRSSEHKRETKHHNPISNIHPDPTSDDKISPSIPRNIQYNPDDFEGDLEGSRKKTKLPSSRQSRYSTGTTTSRQSRSAPCELEPPRKHWSSSEPRKAEDDHKGDRLRGSGTRRKEEHAGKNSGLGSGSAKQRNPLKSLADNGFAGDTTDANLHKNVKKPKRSSYSTSAPSAAFCLEVGTDVSSRKQTSVKNPYLKQPKRSKTVTNAADSDEDEPNFAYQEVVRGRDKREALPAHECEECRKFHNALGPGYDRSQLVDLCSRHRARHAPPSTPPGFWQLTFVDSVSSNKSNNGSD